MSAQVQEFSRRLRVSGTVCRKALEYNRLAQLKLPRGSISSSCLALITIELAASQLGEHIDKNRMQKLSGLQPKAYTSSYQTVMKLLNLTPRLKVKELAVRFGCLEAVTLAEEILRCYRERIKAKYSAAQQEGLDLHKPLYTAAALYCSCKLLKIRSDKNKFFTTSMSTKVLFQNTLDEMLKSAPEKIDDIRRKRKRKLVEDEEEEEEEEAMEEEPTEPKPKRETLHDRLLCDPTSKTFKEWKENAIRQARIEIASAANSIT